MANIVEVLIRARNELSGELNKAEASVSRFGVSSIAKFAAASVSIAAAGLALRKMATSAAEAERVDNLLVDSLQRHNLYSAQNVKALQAQASATAAKVRADDEEIKGIQTLLIDSGVELNMLDAVTKATLDLAVAKRMDGVGAAQLIRMAFISEAGAIRGITTASDGAAGSAERLASITRQLNALFGGKAEADIRGSAGAYSEMTEAFTELSEAGGKWLNKGGAPVAQAIDEQARAIAKWVENASGWQMAMAYISTVTFSPTGLWAAVKLMKGELVTGLEDISDAFNDAGLGVARLHEEMGPLADETGNAADKIYTLADALAAAADSKHRAGIDATADAIMRMNEAAKESLAIRGDRSAGHGAGIIGGVEEGGSFAPALSGLDELVGRANIAATEIEQTINTKLVDATLAGVDQMAAGVGNAFGRMLFYGENFAKGFKDAVKSMAASVVAAIMQMYIKWLLLKALQFIGIPMPFSSGGQISGAPSGGINYAQSGILAGGIPGRDSIPILAMAGERYLSVETNQRLEAVLSKLAAGGGHGGTMVFNTLDAYTLRDWFLYGPGRRMMRRAGVEV